MRHLFIHTVDIQRMTVTADDEGGADKSYSTIYTGVKCWIAKHEGIETIEDFGGSENFAYEMTTEQAGILPADVIIWGDMRFTVTKMQTANTPRGEHHFVLSLEQLK